MIVNTRDTYGCAMKATYGVFGDQELKIYKDLLLKQATWEFGRPGAIQEAIVARYSYGKDLTSKYKTIIPALNAAAVESILADLAESGKVEYIVQR